ncbi:MAG: PHB depolymerase family esterase [Bacteriovorax sp.]|nr:PHB depolymerase family esterase [Bacteriovorax sp.]
MNSTKNFMIFILSVCTTLLSGSLHAGTWKSGSSSGMNGIRNYKLYIPDGLLKNHKAPMVVMLHGCEQNAEDFAKGTRIAQWADKEKFVALLPEQNSSYNPFRCWNWVMPSNNLRAGETAAIIEMMDLVIDQFNLDKDNVFAGGMSAGASMVSILGNCYPERFKALMAHDGTQYYASTTGLDFANVVLSGASNPFSVAARTGYACSSFAVNRPTVMPIIIFHGMNSPLMSPVHAFQVEDEFKAFNDYLDNGIKDNSNFKSKVVINVPETKTYGYNLFTTVNQDNQVYIERYMVDKLGHDWSGGVANLPYNDPKGPDASELMMKFFKKFGL